MLIRTEVIVPHDKRVNAERLKVACLRICLTGGYHIQHIEQMRLFFPLSLL